MKTHDEWRETREWKSKGDQCNQYSKWNNSLTIKEK